MRDSALAKAAAFAFGVLTALLAFVMIVSQLVALTVQQSNCVAGAIARCGSTVQRLLEE